MILNSLFGASYELTNGVCRVDGVIQNSTQPCDDALKGILGIIAAIIIPLLIISVVFLVFWIMALVHAAKHQDIQNRGLWLGILIASFFVGMTWLATIIYYFAVMRPYKKGVAQNPISPAQIQQTPPQISPTQTPPTNPVPPA